MGGRVRLDLPPVLRLLTPREPMPDVVHDFAAFCRMMLDRGEPMPSYAWVERAIREEVVWMSPDGFAAFKANTLRGMGER